MLPRTCLILLVLLSACSPTHNWREVTTPGGSLRAMFPCKPSQERRQVMLAQRRIDMTVLACETGGAMFAVGTADVVDPAALGPSLAALRSAAIANVAGQARTEPLALAGATPHPASGAWRIEGRLPDGRAVEVRVLVFPVGTRIYQVTLFAPRLSPEVAESFIGGLKIK